MMNKSNPFRHLAMAVFACLMAASCSDVTDDGTALPDGKYPMTFTASVDGLSAPNPASRATTDADGKTTWQTDDPVAISMDGGANHKVHKISDAGTGAMIPDGETLYWSKQQETLAAWYPVNYIIGNGGGSEVSITDQSSGFGTLENTLHAPAQDYTYSSGGSVAFTFRHALAKVKVTLTKGDGIEESDLSNATVTFTGYTAGSLGYDGMTGSEGSNSEITPKTETSSGSAATYTALVIPQQMQGKKFIKVTIGTEGAARDYYYTPTGSTDANLEGGKQYNYTITVKKTGLEVVPAPAWGNGGETTGGGEVFSFSVKIPTVPGVTPTIEGATGSSGEIYTTTGNSFSITLSVGDGMTGFNIKGGACDVKRTVENGSYKFTYSNIRSDLELVYGDYAEVGDYYYADGTWSPDYTSHGSSACIGIVFKAGAAQGDVASNYDGKLPDGIHGYVVALTDAHAGKCAWGGDGVLIGTSTNQSDFSGYRNSQKIIEKAQESGHLKPDDPRSDYPAMYYITEYQKGMVIPNSSGWYFPSTGQLTALYNASGGISAKLATAGGSSFQNDDYLSSSEFDRGFIAFNVGCVSFSNGKVNYKEKDDGPCYIRAILTF